MAVPIQMALSLFYQMSVSPAQLRATRLHSHLSSDSCGAELSEALWFLFAASFSVQ